MTVLTTNQTTKNPPNGIRVIHITEIAALDYLEGGYEYRGVIRLQDETGRELLQHTLPTRRKPEWLVNVQYQGSKTFYLELQSRHCGSPHWREIGRVTLHPHKHLGTQSTLALDLQLMGWNNTPQLPVRIRMSGQLAEETREPLSTVPGPDKPAPAAAVPKGAWGKGPAGVMKDEFEVVLPLTEPEKVIVRDVWNKFMAYQDMLVEMFFERLLHEEPELLDYFGEAVELAPRYFAELFDGTIRRLNPHTERTLRESYNGIYPSLTEGPKKADNYITLLTDLGMRPKHWITARRIWVWVLSQVPHLEEYDRENFNLGVQSAPYRFFSIYILPPALGAIEEYDKALPPDMIRQMRRCGEIMAANAQATGIDFYRILFQTYPEVLPYFGRTDVNTLARHLMQAVDFLVRSLGDGLDVIHELRELGRIHSHFEVPPEAYPKVIGPMLAVMKQHIPDFTPELEHAWSILLNRVGHVLQQPMVNRQRVLAQAKEFIDQVAKELAWEPADYERRWDEIKREIKATGSYTHTYEELAYGAQLAWRNAGKCIGRSAWRNMMVRDLRHVTDPDEMFRECMEHLRIATNAGNLQIVMNVFRPKKSLERWGPRIWNSQYIRFAAYEMEDGTLLGDGANKALTQALIQQGWVPPVHKTAYDLLPIVIEVPGQAPKMYEMTPEDVLMVSLEHPSYPQFDALNLKWCAVPAIANFRMEIGGIQYGCVPFNGWFMETEIARNLWEEDRYNQAVAIAQAMGLDTSSEQTLWRDRTFLELNAAVLHSFSKAKVTLVDHQTAARQFMNHDLREKRAGRECPAQWSWVVPSAGGSSTPVWHHEMRDFYLSPSYHYAADKWAVLGAELVIAGEGATSEAVREDRILILYGSETGTAESYARQAARRLSRHHPQVMALDEYNTLEMSSEQYVLVVTSTFGNGEVPGNAKNFYSWIQQQPTGAFDRLNFAVMALGSTVYPHFCAAGAALDRELSRAGGNRMVTMHQGDEIKGQAETFRQWLDLVARLLGEDPTSADVTASAQLQVSFLDVASIPAEAAGNWQNRLPGVEVPVVENRELLQDVIAGGRSTRFMAFDIAGTKLTYETGDHVAIYPKNPQALVERLCNRLGVDSGAWFTTSLVDSQGNAVEGEHAYPAPVNVGAVLTEDFDLLLREPFDELVAALARTATGTEDKETLESWTETLNRGEQDEKCRELKQYMAAHFLTVADLLETFPSAGLTLAQLLAILPKQKPRLYSIASCSLVHRQQIQVTVGVARITTDAGLTRTGLCSGYLAGLDPEQGATVRLMVRTSNFRPPRDPHAPVLMVGPGTGVSPLVGFLQHREAQLRNIRSAKRCPFGYDSVNQESGYSELPLTQTRLFFGCHNQNDYLYQQQLESWRSTGVLTHLDVAFSRLGDEKTYVQHLINRQKEDVWALLSQPNCHYYVCGDAKMADDVFTVLMAIAKTTGGLSHAEAVEFFRKMQQEKRFVMDVWGVLHNFREALVDLQEEKYTQGERWLQQLTAV